MNDEYTNKVKMVGDLVDLMIEKGLMKDHSDKNKKVAQYLGDSDAVLRDLMKLVQTAEVAKAPEAPNMGGWIGTYDFKQPVEQRMMFPTPSILRGSAPFRVLMAGPATVTASVSHAETGSKVEVSGDLKAIRWLFTEVPFSFLAEAGNE